jgi:hypothetical protein
MDASTSTPIATNDTNAASNITAPSLFSRIMAKVAEFLMPTFLRREYSNILNTFAKGKYAYLALVLAIVFGIAEWQQPGYFPRPEEWTYALVRTFPFTFLSEFVITTSLITSTDVMYRWVSYVQVHSSSVYSH